MWNAVKQSLPMLLLIAGYSSATEPTTPSETSHVEEVRDLTPPALNTLAAPSAHGVKSETVAGNLSPMVPLDPGIYFRGEYLLGRPRTDRPEYAIRNGIAGLAIAGPTKSVRYDYGNGFTTELGYRFGPRGLDLDASFAYTYFAASGDSSASASGGGVLFPTLTRPGLVDRALNASLDVALNVNLYDLQLARRILFDEHFAMRAFGGLRFANIRESLNASYDGLDARDSRVNTRSRFEGFGPTLGGEAIVAAPRGIHFYLRASGGLLVGDSFNQWTETNDSGNSLYLNTPYDIRKSVSFASMGVGLGWQYQTISIRFGYDVTEWFGVTERLRLSSDIAPGSISSRTGNIGYDLFFVQCSMTF